MFMFSYLLANSILCVYLGVAEGAVGERGVMIVWLFIALKAWVVE